MRSFVEDVLKEHQIPGAAIAHIRNGVISVDCFGAASNLKPTPVGESTIFEVGSLSKPVFASAFLRWCDRSGFDLDAPLQTVCPIDYDLWNVDFKEPDFAKISARMILSHTSGFNNWDNWNGAHVRRLKFEPGSKFSYSGESYIYLQKIFEHLNGKSLEAHVREDFFPVLGLERSSFIWHPKWETDFADGHGERNEGVGKFWTEPFAAFSLLSTAADLAKFLLVFLTESQSAPWMKNMTTSQVSLTPSCSWGLGWGMEHGSAAETFWHWGNLGDYQCFMAGSRELADGIIILTNSGNAKPAFADLAHHYLGRSLLCAHSGFVKLIEAHKF